MILRQFIPIKLWTTICVSNRHDSIRDEAGRFRACITLCAGRGEVWGPSDGVVTGGDFSLSSVVNMPQLYAENVVALRKIAAA